MKKFFQSVLMVASFLLLSGATCRGPVVPVVIEPEDTIRCPAACEHLRALGCEEGTPLADGTTCETFCVDTQKNGYPLNPTCIMSIKKCTEVEGCTKTAR